MAELTTIAVTKEQRDKLRSKEKYPKEPMYLIVARVFPVEA